MGKFGWSYPAGCSGTLYDESAGPCDVCGQDVDSWACVCPECPECGAVGDPACYVPGKCGLIRSDQQIRLRREAELLWEDEARAEAAALARQVEDERDVLGY